ncbi:MAG: hypothetical protein U9O96_05035 [Candidatus Thermoplasmatota archaeon]|nr:hypothetical protein [Candidatus Thermoplasmatota archaeon]
MKIGIFVCIVLIASFIPATDIIGDNIWQMKENQISLGNGDADVPAWEVGNYWTYNMGISYEASGASADITLHLKFEVTEVGSENYILTFNGGMTGSISLAGIIEGNIQNAVIGGKADIGKSNLAIEKVYDVHIEGEIKRQMVTNPFWADLGVKQNVTPVVSPYNFPINVNETWTVPVMTFWLYVNGEVSLAIPYTIDYDFPVYIAEHGLTCTAKETITVPAGTYRDAFHVSGIGSQYEFWYSPAASNVIKAVYNNIRMWYNESLYWDLNELSAGLTDTNLKPPNEPPYQPGNPNPANGSDNVDVNTHLSWTGGDPDGNPVVYDVYFGTDSNPPSVATGQSSMTYDPGALNYNTTYYWRIVAFDNHNHSTTGSTWTFTTTASVNNPPDKPSRPSGPTSGNIGTSYSYSSSTTDTDGDQVYYLFDWADGTTSGWLGPYDSGQTVNASHTWSETDNYSIKVKAKDTNGAESEWSDPLVVSMPMIYQFHIQKILNNLHNWLLLMARIFSPYI